MNYKVQGTIRRNKKNFIIFAILWVILSIVFVMPVSYCIVNATMHGTFHFDLFIAGISNAMTGFGTVFAKIFSEQYIGTYVDVLFKFSLVYAVFMLVGLLKTAPKNEYTDIEHGSSDWSKNGEQYRILNNKKGIILARENYLPVDKRGNVNVLVVGRIRIW